jgi:prepilin-type N-terminal cleavage/methylation domain-containing protein
MHPNKSQKGFSLVELLVVVAVIGIISAVAIPNLMASRRAANEANAISAMRTISTAEVNYWFTFGGGSYGSLEQLASERIIDLKLANATDAATARSGYIYGVHLINGGASYIAGSAPITASTGSRNFSCDQPGVIYAHTLNAGVVPTATDGGTAVGN